MGNCWSNFQESVKEVFCCQCGGDEDENCFSCCACGGKDVTDGEIIHLPELPKDLGNLCLSNSNVTIKSRHLHICRYAKIYMYSTLFYSN